LYLPRSALAVIHYYRKSLSFPRLLLASLTLYRRTLSFSVFEAITPAFDVSRDSKLHPIINLLPFELLPFVFES